MATLIPEFKELLSRRIAQFGQLKTSAQTIGDVERVEYFTVEIEKAESTLAQLNTLPQE